MHVLTIDNGDRIALTDSDLEMLTHAVAGRVTFWRDQLAKEGLAADLHRLATGQLASWASLLGKLEGE